MARRFRGPLVTEGVQTGDGRVIAAGATDWAELPLPFAWIRDGDQHINLTEVAPQVGIIDAITRDAATGDLIGEGMIDDANPDGAELVRRMDAGLASHGARQFVSIDPDDWAVEILMQPQDPAASEVLLLASAGRGPVPSRAPEPELVRAAAGDPDPAPGSMELLYSDSADMILERYTHMRIRGATACAVSAFTTAWIELVPDAPVTASTQVPMDLHVAVRAGAGVIVRPPVEAFRLPEPEPGAEDDGTVYGMPVQELIVEQPDGSLAVPFTIVERDGIRWAFGHAARWGQCHVGYPGQCITPPESLAAYAHFHHGAVLCDDGTTVATGPLTMGTDHAAADLLAPAARDHYANTGLAFADVRATNGGLGVWLSGVVRDVITEPQLQVVRASSLSGDWRRIGADLEFIGALAVNVPGFPIARELVAAAGLRLPMAALAASAYTVDNVQMSLTAAGIVQRCPECQRRAMAAREYGQQLVAAATPAQMDEALALLHTLDLRTRHLTADATSHALAMLRR